jgi:DNA-binding response OmpR family regulator
VSPGLLVVSDDAAWVERLDEVSKSLGLPLVRLMDRRDLSAIPEGAGVAVIDGLPRDASGWAELVRDRLPGCVLTFALSPQDLAATGLGGALAEGADGFLAKDSSAARLTQQLRALRRRGSSAARGLSSPAADLRLDAERGQVQLANRGRWQRGPALSPKESALLRFFLENPGRLHDRASLLEAVWGGDCDARNPEVLDKHVGSLRRKLGAPGRALRTVRGRGYCWG